MMSITTLRHAVRSFRSDRKGNVLTFFALAIVPTIGLTGAMVDYTRATSARAKLHAAIDSAALMAARDAGKLTDAQLRERINNWIRANLDTETAAKFTVATIGINRTARTINIDAQIDVDNGLARLIGHNKTVVASRNQATWGSNTIELALALDNTGSMASSGKMAALKTASLDLIKIMKDASYEPDQIKISIVPFSTRVILDTSYKDESWLRWDQTKDVTVTTCTGSGWRRVCVDTVTQEKITKSTWQGCVADRDKSYDVQDGDGASSNASQYPADFCDPYSPASQAKILPLTSDWTALNARINAMTPVGATNVTMGAVWGMATLSPSAPFTEAKPASTVRLKKFMILLTDGLNTRNRFDGNGSDHEPKVDERTKLACDNAKAAGIVVYTVRVIEGSQDLLKKCASDESKYYEVSAASQLTPVFQEIAREISAIRLTN